MPCLLLRLKMTVLAGSVALGLSLVASFPSTAQIDTSTATFNEAMQAVNKDLMQMKMLELKEELEARGEAKTGAKAWLRRRLHAAIVRAHLEADAGDGL